jgi:hypothetical protein
MNIMDEHHRFPHLLPHRGVISGVVATMPNFSERMKREGVLVEDVTAGQFDA